MNKNITEHVCKKSIYFPDLNNSTLLYTGTLFNGAPHGQGIIYQSSNTNMIRYEGNFVNGRVKGYGRYYFDGVLTSEGYHIDFYLNGQGTIYQGSKIYTIGNHEKDKLQGYGRKYYDRAGMDEGIFQDNIMVTGKWVHDIFTFTGEYKNNQAYNYGLLELNNSNIKKIWGFFEVKLIKINEMITYINGKETEVKLLTNNSSYYSACMKKYPDLMDKLYVYNNTNSIHFCMIDIIDGDLHNIEILYNIVEVISYDD